MGKSERVTPLRSKVATFWKPVYRGKILGLFQLTNEKQRLSSRLTGEEADID